MQIDLSVSIIQPDTIWENPSANRIQLEEKIASINASPDLVVLPEMFTTGFSVNAKELAEPMNSTTHKWLIEMAQSYQTAICGSLIIKEGTNYYNRLLFIQASGETFHYDKRHLFGYGGEDNYFSSGTERLIVSVKGWKICPLICYDLRFPVFARNKNLAYDILIYSASWPESRIEVWDTLLKARAIENQAYVIGVNRSGIDGNNLQYCGHSTIIDPKGKGVLTLESIPDIGSLSLSRYQLDDFRKKFPAYLDADDFELG